jgi:hypothetical protein
LATILLVAECRADDEVSIVAVIPVDDRDERTVRNGRPFMRVAG